MGGFPTREYAAEEHLWYVFAALATKNVNLAKEMDASLRKEQKKPINKHSMIQPFTGKIYSDRLKSRLKAMPIETLEAYRQCALKFPDKGILLVQEIGRFLIDECERREDAKTEEQMRFASGEVHMNLVLSALRSTKPFNDLNIAKAVGKFVEAMQPLYGEALSDSAAFDVYQDRSNQDRLNKTLNKMSPARLEAAAAGVKGYLREVQDPVVEGIGIAVEAQLEQRQRTNTNGPSS